MREGNLLRNKGFTLIELLVVISIIALLISILLPSLKCARDQAKSVKCGSTLRMLSNAAQSYATDFNSYYPGANTTGASLMEHYSDQEWHKDHIPVQRYDWITPLLTYETTLPAKRSSKFYTIFQEYQCPSIWADPPIIYSGSIPPDINDFRNEPKPNPGISYLMPITFQHWGQNQKNITVGYDPLDRRYGEVKAEVGSLSWSTRTDEFISQLERVGPSAEKIMFADGTRYVDGGNGLVYDIDIHQNPSVFGSFTTSGGWWTGSTSYGIGSKDRTIDGRSPRDKSPSDGENQKWSYRHGCDKDGKINAAFFDGHVQSLSNRESRNVNLWYPSGTVVTDPGGGMTRVIDNYKIR